LEAEIKTLMPSLTEKLRKLNLSSYEVAAYLSLISLRDWAKKDQIMIETKKYGQELPETRVYAVLSSLESKGLVEKSEDYPKKYRAHATYSALKGLVNKQKHALDSAVEEAWTLGLSRLTTHEGMWEVGTEEDAVHLTRTMWQRASSGIYLMTRTGDWIESHGLLPILKEKLALKNFEMGMIFTEFRYLPSEKRERARRVSQALSRMGAQVYQQVPSAIRLDVTDPGHERGEALFFLYEENKKARYYRYYTRIPSAVNSFARLFAFSVLGSEEKQDSLRIALGQETRRLRLFESTLLKESRS
jgi:predicted transcriptional regulator